MAKFKHIMDVFKLLPNTNCRKCNKLTCLAFAAAVFQGQISLGDCPYIDENTIIIYGAENDSYESGIEQDYFKAMDQSEAQQTAAAIGPCWPWEPKGSRSGPLFWFPKRPGSKGMERGDRRLR